MILKIYFVLLYLINILLQFVFEILFGPDWFLLTVLQAFSVRQNEAHFQIRAV